VTAGAGIRAVVGIVGTTVADPRLAGGAGLGADNVDGAGGIDGGGISPGASFPVRI
jgi:hypothetical protein